MSTAPGDITVMTPEQESHLMGLKSEIVALLDGKYRLGAREHNGCLLQMTPKQLVLETILEQIDGLAYALTAYEKME
jgi:hypothetical protein